ncbi:MAG: beta-ketoacyl-ACP synthase I [Rhodospirillaceae bacterium]|nr:beta-ketoacyl-ACP synthase I [Rhodospirillaceae bacterium]MBT3929761.1 beta-ketoacyl-ACP synthase I [Rhodospirillaceae bacterium]MBT4772846.1 beta-ketoacyl-ACP synthase I [Rhodospirillaceae bacterium]MBT5360095.1 beta-ketoacyl-ACP synthase I [Rhodospirillaceae bacterium]MBT5770922.1 beta-ketoacyl-ACP synthase I [Rhodospirillaceae bacterium]
MRRVAVTGLGIVSPIGANSAEVTDSLKAGRSGIVHSDVYAEMGFRSHVHGAPNVDFDNHIDRKLRRFMGDGAAYNYIAMSEAIADSGLTEADIHDERTGLVMGSGGPSTSALVEAADTAREKSPKRVGPYAVPKAMCSTLSANMSTAFKMRGLSYSISSACSTSAHCIGNGSELIQMGKQDVVFAGGAEELHWSLTVLFDAMGALSSKYNDTPERASRPYDVNRDGFVIAGGAGVVVLEEMERAKARGAKIYGELVGYGATSDGVDMVAPSGEGAVRCMRMATAGLGNQTVDYINAHGTSTPVGDIIELGAINEVFGAQRPHVASTKSLTGHSQGATGAHEAIYSLLMMQHDFIAASANIEDLDPDAGDAAIVTARIDNAGLNCVMSNSFGFGGTNATLAFQRHDG